MKATFACALLIPSLLLANAAEAASIGGTVFEDRDRNGLFDSAELPLRNARVQLIGLDGTVQLQTRTLADGTWQFDNLLDGNYVVSVSARGFRQSLPDPTAVPSPIPDFPFGSARYSTYEGLVNHLRGAASFDHIGLGDSIGFGFNFCGSLLGEDGYFEPTSSRLAGTTAPALFADKQSIPGHETDDLLDPGISGDFPFTSNDVFYAIDNGAELVSISIGGNDFLGSEDGGDPAVAAALVVARRNLQEILSSLVTELPDAAIEINTVYDNEEGGDALHNTWVPIWNQMLRETAWAQDRPVRIAEIYPEYRHDASGVDLGEPGLICNDLFGFDGIHPVNAGYDVHEQKLWQSIGGVTLSGSDRLDVDTGFSRARRLLLPLGFNDVSGGTINPTDALTTDGIGALVPSDNREFRVEPFLNNPPANLSLNQALLKIRFRTTGAPIDDFYRFEASVDGTFSAPGSTPTTWNTIIPLVGSSGNGGAEILAFPDQPGFRTVAAPLTIGAPTTNDGSLDWTDLETLSVRVVTTAVGAPDAFSIEWDSAWVEAFTSLPGAAADETTRAQPLRLAASKASPERRSVSTSRLLASLGEVGLRSSAIDELASRPDAVNGLLAHLSGGDELERSRAALALGRSESRSAAILASLRVALEDTSLAVRAMAIGALAAHGDLDSAALIADLRSESSLRLPIARALGSLDHPGTLDALVEIATDRDNSATTRRWAVRGLAGSNHHAARSPLAALSASEDARVRRLAEAGLARAPNE